MTSRPDRALVLGLSPTGLSVARSLAAHGVEVFGVDALWYEIGHFSRAVRHDRRVSRFGPGPELLAGLLAFGAEQACRPALFIASDVYVEFVANNRTALEPHYLLTESMRQEVNSILLNKRTFYEACLQLGAALPKTYFPVTAEQAHSAAKEIRYPAILKPSLGHELRKRLRGKKLVEVADEAELLRWWRVFQEWQADVVIQECIPGTEQNIAVAGLYVDRAGRCHSIFTAKKYRQYPPDFGSASYIESKWLPDIAKLSEDLVGKLGYRGICGTEFKWDVEDACWKLIEINCRPTLWFSITRATGVDIVWDAYRDLMGHPTVARRGTQIEGVRWQLFVRDFASSLHFLRRGELSLREFWRTTIDQRNKEWAVCAWNDWGANLGYVVNTLAQVWYNFVRPRT